MLAGKSGTQLACPGMNVALFGLQRTDVIAQALQTLTVGCIGAVASIDLSALLTRNVSNRSVAVAHLL